MPPARSGQIIPPSIILVMLGDVMTSAYQQAQLEMGIFSPKTVSVGDLFAGALIIFIMVGIDGALNLYMFEYFWELDSQEKLYVLLIYPVGIILGCPPVVEYTCPQKVKMGVDELTVAGGRAGGPISIVFGPR